MEPDKDNSPASEGQPSEAPATSGQDVPSDALSRTPEDLDQEQAAEASANPTPTPVAGEKKPSALKQFFRRVNVYFLIFLLLVAVAAVIAVVNYLNSQKAPPTPNISSQTLSQDTLKQLANSDASVGSTSQTLTIQGNAIIAGQTLMRGNLNVAGNFQSGGSIKGPSLTISGDSNLGTTQANSLQVSGTTAIQGNTTMRNLNVAGTSTFSGPMTASQITASKLILSGNAELQIPNHISFTGPSPSRTINSSTLGAGGSASINGSDTTGTININTGAHPSAGCFVQITFHQAFSNQPHVIVSPIGASAGKLQYYVNRTSSGFSVCTANAADANQVFGFDYFVTN